jgi:uroporphyrinogen-III synthase
LAWQRPDPANFDAVLLTSANTLRHGGDQIKAVRHLPAWCVGEATAAAAREAGFSVAATGGSDAADLISTTPLHRWLWLAGQRHQPLTVPEGASLVIVPVYAATPIGPPPAFGEALTSPAIIMAYSRASAERLAALVPVRHMHRLVAISPAVASAASDGWAEQRIAQRPDDGEMVALAAALCQNAAHG